MAREPLGFFLVIILTTFKIIAIALEIGLYDKRLPRKQIAKWLKILASVFALAIFICGIVNMAREGFTMDDEATECRNANADIIGDGVRIATWVQEILLVLIALVGCVQYSPTAIKEIGSGLLISHISLAIALVVSLHYRELSLIDAALGSMILDAQNMVLSIQLVNKETLASRWQVATVIVGQLTGLAIQGVLLGYFEQGKPSSDGCKCFSVFWWAWFSNCSAVSQNSKASLWIYYSLRCLTSLHCQFIAAREANDFDRAEKLEREIQCADDNHHQCNVCATCRSCGYKRGSCTVCLICATCRRCLFCKRRRLPRLPSFVRFSERPATCSFMFLEYFAFAVLSMVGVEKTMSDYDIKASSSVHSIGQVTALVIMATTAARSLWVFAYRFNE
ncbi:hypothetical protein ASPBRDRAFT_70348 [Aspergillus brasiliensis CBS 101740]|uniref:Uncharacterized protein n=1 Tax=Aspergillus brasiliensis (strain CBS 101740 / IMI 381727 / IBT 21946) TaxID=767769 RepID=A0A1L9U1C5_ASPBC|nr:hypothetical protein ASPBRDRAFT_70348 [Aspergillus brasiliensis CBS 101740]